MKKTPTKRQPVRTLKSQKEKIEAEVKDTTPVAQVVDVSEISTEHDNTAFDFVLRKKHLLALGVLLLLLIGIVASVDVSFFRSSANVTGDEIILFDVDLGLSDSDIQNPNAVLAKVKINYKKDHWILSQLQYVPDPISPFPPTRAHLYFQQIDTNGVPVEGGGVSMTVGPEGSSWDTLSDSFISNIQTQVPIISGSQAMTAFDIPLDANYTDPELLYHYIGPPDPTPLPPPTEPPATPTPTGLPPELVGCWSLDEIVSGQLEDSSQQANNGTPQGDVVCNNSVSGKFGSACAFNPVNGDTILINNPSGIPINDEEYTIEAWIRKDQTDSDFFLREIIGWGEDVIGGVTALSLIDDPTLGKGVSVRWNVDDLLASVPELTDGSWHHVATVFQTEGTIFKGLYIDGKLVKFEVYDQISNPLPIRVPQSINMHIGGAVSPYNTFKGEIDEVRIWNTALSRERISQIWDRPMCNRDIGNDFGLNSAKNLLAQINPGGGGLPGSCPTGVSCPSGSGGELPTVGINQSHQLAYKTHIFSEDVPGIPDRNVPLSGGRGFTSTGLQMCYSDKECTVPGHKCVNNTCSNPNDGNSGDDGLVLPLPPDPGVPNGLLGYYHSGTTLEFENLGFSRVDPSVDFDWGDGPPYPTPEPSQGIPGDRCSDHPVTGETICIGNDNFSVRWSGDVYLPLPGLYYFATYSDDGTKFWFNDQYVRTSPQIKNWIFPFTTNLIWAGNGKDPGTVAYEIDEPGWYPIRIEYYEGNDNARIQLWWQVTVNQQSVQGVIPSAYLRIRNFIPPVTNIREGDTIYVDAITGKIIDVFNSLLE